MLRIVLLFSASAMALLIGLQFLGDPTPTRPFEGMTVTVMYGKDNRSGLQRIIHGACGEAEFALGCTVDAISIDWKESAILDEFRRQSSIVPSGICFMGYPATESMFSDMEDLRELDVPMSTYNTRFPAAEARYSVEGFGYVGIDGYAAGYELAQAAIQKHGLQAGDPAMLLGDLDHPARIPFRDGCLAAFSEGGIEVRRRIATADELATSPGALANDLAAMDQAETLPKLLCLTEFPVSLGSELLNLAGITHGDIPLIGLGIDPRTDRNRYGPGGNSGHVSLVATQDLALQTYMAIVQVCMRRSSGATGLQIITPFEIVGLENGSRAVLRSSERRTVQVY